MRADFLRECQNSLWQTSPEIMHLQAWKKLFQLILCHSFWSDYDLGTLGSQNDSLYLSFEKDFHAVYKKIAKNYCKMANYES